MELSALNKQNKIVKQGARSISIIISTFCECGFATEVKMNNGEFFDSFQNYFFSSQNICQTRPSKM